jgi:hypothetical protein
MTPDETIARLRADVAAAKQRNVKTRKELAKYRHIVRMLAVSKKADWYELKKLAQEATK